MKTIVIILLVLMFCLSLLACDNAGITTDVKIDYGSSVLFSEAEVKSAVEAVLAKFKNFSGCDLLRLWYDESKSNSAIESYLTSGRGSVNGVERENVIILFSDFYVDSSGGDSSFNPDSTYTDWM